MEINHLRYFYEVAKVGSFSKAALKMRVSQPAVSRMVKALEDSVGLQLLERDRRNVRVTDAGRMFLERCGSIFREIDNLSVVSADYQGDCVGEVRCGASDNICNYLLPEIIVGFCKRYPKVNFKILAGTSGAVKDSILNEKATFGFFYTPLLPTEKEDFESTEIARAEFVIVVSGAEKRVGKKFDRNVFLRELRYIGSRQSDYRAQIPALKMHQLLGLEPKHYVGTNSQEMQKRLVMQGLGYSVMPAYMVREEVNDGQLRIVSTEVPLESPVFLVQRKGRLLSKPARMFSGWVATDAQSIVGRI